MLIPSLSVMTVMISNDNEIGNPGVMMIYTGHLDDPDLLIQKNTKIFQNLSKTYIFSRVLVQNM